MLYLRIHNRFLDTKTLKIIISYQTKYDPYRFSGYLLLGFSSLEEAQRQAYLYCKEEYYKTLNKDSKKEFNKKIALLEKNKQYLDLLNMVRPTNTDIQFVYEEFYKHMKNQLFKTDLVVKKGFIENLCFS